MVAARLNPTPPLTSRPNAFEKAGVLAASAAGFGLGLSGLPFYTSGVFVTPLNKAFGWPLASIQGGLTLLLLFNVVSLPATAWLVRRFGSRPVALGAVALFSLSFMSFATIDSNLWGFYLHWLLLSATGAGTLAVTWTQAISAIFGVRRGTAVGFAMMGTGVTALVAPVLTNTLIEQFGWRTAYLIVGALPLIIAGPLVWFLFWDRTPVGGTAPRQRSPASSPPVSDYRFWLIGVSFLVVGAAVSGVIPNLIRLLITNGYPAAKAAGLASTLGFFVIIGRLGGGYLLDRLWGPGVSAAFFLSAGGACLLLGTGSLGGPAIVLVAAILGLAAGVELDILPYLTSRYFGVLALSSTLAGLSMFFFVGAAVGPWGFGRLHDLTGSYIAPLSVAAVLFAFGGLALLPLGRYPDATAAVPPASP